MRKTNSSVVAILCLSLGIIAAAKADWGGGGAGYGDANVLSLMAAQNYVKQQGSITVGNMTKFAGAALVADGGTLDQVSFTQPATGFSATIPNGIRYYIIGNNILLAAGGLTMPASPIDGQRVTISSKSGVTLFSISANTGQTLYGGMASLTGFATWIYRASDTSWYRVG